MKLLIESSHDVEMLHETTSKGSSLYIQGIFAQSRVLNGNKRYYERDIMEAAVSKYQADYVGKRRALGELNHPDRPFPDPEQAAILIESLEWDGDNVIGKARVLTGTPKGQIVAGLLEGGFNLGVSTRGLGSLKESKGVKYVQKDFMMTAVDCVDMPSGPDCYVNALSESVNWVSKNGVWVAEDTGLIDSQLKEDMFLEKLEAYFKTLKR